MDVKQLYLLFVCLFVKLIFPLVQKVGSEDWWGLGN